MSSEPMSAPTPKAVKKKSRLLDGIIVMVIIVLVVAGAVYQESVAGFFRLHAWDRGAPGQAVVGFLEAGKQGDRIQADAYIGNPQYQAIIQDGKLLGYSTSVQAEKILFLFEDLIPTTSLQPTSTEFNFVGNGSAEVVVPNRQGKPVSYSLMLMNGQWKIIGIRGGKMETAPRPGLAPPGGKKRT
ncbi:MAG TPA: hypothetical protein VFB21_16040 [Chthonomonadaceae bacterium]|nr:hypothetical protein [Chthonomonadaceae bacterium]